MSQAEFTGRVQQVAVSGQLSQEAKVLSGVPQGSVLGPLLFLLFINDISDNTIGNIRLFADDTKDFIPITTPVDCLTLQSDLSTLSDWSHTWQLAFNHEKCKILHVGNNNPRHIYTMHSGNNTSEIPSGSEEKDLGVTFTADLKFSKHIHNITNKANSLTGMVRRTFRHMDKTMFLAIYKAIIRPHLEYASPVWSPYLKKDIQSIEKVQQRATRIVKEVHNRDGTRLSYPERLKYLGLPTLEYRRLRSDLKETYKILHGISDISPEEFFKPARCDYTRGHAYKLDTQRCRTKQRQQTFSHRIINCWNNLHSDIVNAPSLNSFKSRLNSLWRHPIKFDPHPAEA